MVVNIVSYIAVVVVSVAVEMVVISWVAVVGTIVVIFALMTVATDVGMEIALVVIAIVIVISICVWVLISLAVKKIRLKNIMTKEHEIIKLK